MLLAGDIGGTKTDLAIFSHEAGPHAPLVQTQVRSADYPSLQALAAEFLKRADMAVEQACFDVAGPVINGRAKITNLPWVIDEARRWQRMSISNRSIKVMATGGIYVAGGIPLHMLSALEARFMRAFKRKGRFVELMSQIPVHVILTRAALLGAAVYGLEHFNDES